MDNRLNGRGFILTDIFTVFMWVISFLEAALMKNCLLGLRLPL